MSCSKEDSILIHEDWWGKCRSCRFWNGKDAKNFAGRITPRWEPAKCENPASELYQQETWTEGHCPKWDSFDIETAFELMEEWNKIRLEKRAF